MTRMAVTPIWRLWEYAMAIQAEPGLPEHARSELIAAVQRAARILLQNVKPEHLGTAQALLEEIEKLRA